MARKYVRDNRGRFASGGSGATARGGRLKTASGNKRATQTMKAAGAGGVIKGRTARTVAGEKVMAKMGKRGAGATVNPVRTNFTKAQRGPATYGQKTRVERLIKQAESDHFIGTNYANFGKTTAERRAGALQAIKAYRTLNRATLARDIYNGRTTARGAGTTVMQARKRVKAKDASRGGYHGYGVLGGVYNW